MSAASAPGAPGAPSGNGPLLGSLLGAGRLLLRVPRWGAALASCAWAGLIWRLSSAEGRTQPGHWIWSYLSNLFHAFLFGILALGLALALPRRDEPFRWSALDRRGCALVLALTVVWGALDEWHQSRVPRRDASALDLLTDLAGIASVLAIALYAGARGARESRARGVLALGLAACCASALLATLAGD